MNHIRPVSDGLAHGSRSIAIGWRSVSASAATLASAIMMYPVMLALFFRSGRIATQAPGSSLRLIGWAGVAISMALALSLPLLGFVMARMHSGRPISPRDLAICRMAHLAWMAPPLYTATGVWLSILGLPGWTALGLGTTVWLIVWPIVFALVLRAADRRLRKPVANAKAPPVALRVSHGVVAALLVLTFIGAHLANHVVGLFGYAADKAVMDVLRMWYRSTYVQPIIIAGFLFMMVTGPMLARYRTVTGTDGFGTLQTMTGAYLAAFLFSHMSAVLVLARAEHGIDTDWHYAIDAPTGFFADPGDVRLIPHYLWGVFSVVAHAACGLRGVMLAHGAKRRVADRIAWGVSAAGAGLSALIMSALLGARV